MPAFVLDRLGDEITATLETSFRDLVDWNAGVRTRNGLLQQAHDEKLLALAQQIGGRRVDMALFTGQDEHKPKDEQDFLALVEFKRGWIDGNRIPGGVSDRDKLLMLLAHIDTCPWGIVCGWCKMEHRKWQTDDSIKETLINERRRLINGMSKNFNYLTYIRRYFSLLVCLIGMGIVSV
jgi:hypothetical protein